MPGWLETQQQTHLPKWKDVLYEQLIYHLRNSAQCIGFFIPWIDRHRTLNKKTLTDADDTSLPHLKDMASLLPGEWVQIRMIALQVAHIASYISPDDALCQVVERFDKDVVDNESGTLFERIVAEAKVPRCIALIILFKKHCTTAWFVREDTA